MDLPSNVTWPTYATIATYTTAVKATSRSRMDNSISGINPKVATGCASSASIAPSAEAAKRPRWVVQIRTDANAKNPAVSQRSADPTATWCSQNAASNGQIANTAMTKPITRKRLLLFRYSEAASVAT